MAWLAELFPHDRQREWVLGATQAFSSVGGLLAALVSSIVVSWAVRQPAPCCLGSSCPPSNCPPSSCLPSWTFWGPSYRPADWRYTPDVRSHTGHSPAGGPGRSCL